MISLAVHSLLSKHVFFDYSKAPGLLNLELELLGFYWFSALSRFSAHPVCCAGRDSITVTMAPKSSRSIALRSIFVEPAETLDCLKSLSDSGLDNSSLIVVKYILGISRPQLVAREFFQSTVWEVRALESVPYHQTLQYFSRTSCSEIICILPNRFENLTHFETILYTAFRY